MIPVMHTRGCGGEAFKVFGAPIGRDLMAFDAMLAVKDADGTVLGTRPAVVGEPIICGSCGVAVNLDEAREQVGSIDNTPGVPPHTSVVTDE